MPSHEGIENNDKIYETTIDSTKRKNNDINMLPEIAYSNRISKIKDHINQGLQTRWTTQNTKLQK